ncbi:MAG: tRNA-dihydrouridine synthase [Thermotogaceae bacterium]|nr:tRNA-dihydrouridine synthase [Thermotogaceae bacterium]
MLTFPCNVGLAPLAGYTNRVFRKIAYQHGACFAYTEMIAARSVFENFETVEKMLPDDNEPFTGIQIFGSDVSYMVKASVYLQKHGKFIDINAGCPVKKVIKKGAGGALVRDLSKLLEMVKEIKRNIEIPLTVKTRIGWDRDEAERIYYSLASAGADLVVFHARTVKQGFTGRADWKVLGGIRKKPVPLYISGDIFTPEDAKAALEISGADGVVVARGAIGNPWIFDQIRNYISTDNYKEPSVKDRLNLFLNHIEENVEFFGEPNGIIEMRKFIAGYTKSLPFARRFRERFMKVQTLEEVRQIFRDFMKNLT